MPNIAQRVRNQRKLLHLSIQETAEKANLSESLISRFERGVITNISLEKFTALCEALEIDMGEIFNSNEELTVEDIYTNRLLKKLKKMSHDKREKISKNLLELWEP